MSLRNVFYLSMFFCVFKTAKSMLNLDDEGKVIIKNFYECSKGKYLSKLGSLLSNQTTKSVKECCFKCVQNKECLSVNTIALDQSRYQCELLNWAGTGFQKYLTEKANSKSYVQLQPTCSPNPCQNGGECTVKDGGSNYTCNCLYANTDGRNCEIQKCILFDFETGRLDGWTLTGTAFNHQPTYGDNTLARGRASSKLTGNWFIGTFENRSSPSLPAGGQQGDGPSGTATSPPFIIRGTKLRFLIGGGNNIDTERLELLINGSVVNKATSAQRDHPMKLTEFSVTAFQGRVAHVRIVDMSSLFWGVINVDHIEDSYCSE